MSDLETFRRETRAWLEANCPPEMRRPMTSENDTYWGGRNARFSSEPQRVWFERMRDKGWTVPDWPKEYGGGGLDRAEHKVLREEMSAMGARSPLSSFGIWMLGPALLKYGNEAQKKEHLPKIAAGLIRWCQGYSEPNAGSDLASLQTRAESDGDDFIINGQKIWTSYANYADWIFCLVRTDPSAKKHDGISFILFDMASKGVSTKPILLISGRSPFCETFFDNVRAPKAKVGGTANRGWDVAKYLLQHERAMISGMGERGVGRPLGQVAADSVGTDEQGRLEDPMLRGQIATFEIDEAALAAAAERAVDLAKAGQSHPAFSSAMKYYGTELNKRRYEILMSAGGIDAPAWDSARGLISDKAPVSHLRQLRDANDTTGFSRELWKAFAEMGFSGLLVPENFGGSGLGCVEAGVVMEEIGRTLMPSPFLATAVLAASALSRGGSEAQKSAHLPKISDGSLLAALAVDEGAKHRPLQINLQAVRSGNGFKLNGAKAFVVDGHTADLLIVAGRTGGSAGERNGLTLFLVDPKAKGVAVERTMMVDAHNAARIEFANVEVDADHVLGEVDQGGVLLDGVLNIGRGAVASEMVGLSEEVFGRSVTYLKERKQFGKLIGEFQALQHRAAELYIDIEITRAAVLKALQTLDGDFDKAGAAVAVAKARAGSTATLAVQEGVQMHGGMGMTDQFDIGFFMKRARVCQELFGDSNYHADQLARMKSY